MEFTNRQVMDMRQCLEVITDRSYRLDNEPDADERTKRFWTQNIRDCAEKLNSILLAGRED